MKGCSLRVGGKPPHINVLILKVNGVSMSVKDVSLLFDMIALCESVYFAYRGVWGVYPPRKPD